MSRSKGAKNRTPDERVTKTLEEAKRRGEKLGQCWVPKGKSAMLLDALTTAGAQGQGMTAQELAAAIGSSVDVVRMLTLQLIRAGKVEKSPITYRRVP
jgi:hypothetical protein